MCERVVGEKLFGLFGLGKSPHSEPVAYIKDHPIDYTSNYQIKESLRERDRKKVKITKK